ncbi:hypothetical protein L211DRAFT_327558 [Terfezia boudieri ATCC MYA-4762]|uniref:Uncharacterized protein n=1 Tax=Terfezia boudieri ATCC MYA-4762 TaxID=1051890 RepID=A0A3N4LI10_9PEZI|nr:hypothetical protein L211DRAFT_327558 [Terfezia boudieri ATCC MYA-4762]
MRPPPPYHEIPSYPPPSVPNIIGKQTCGCCTVHGAFTSGLHDKELTVGYLHNPIFERQVSKRWKVRISAIEAFSAFFRPKGCPKAALVPPPRDVQCPACAQEPAGFKKPIPCQLLRIS